MRAGAAAQVHDASHRREVCRAAAPDGHRVGRDAASDDHRAGRDAARARRDARQAGHLQAGAVEPRLPAPAAAEQAAGRAPALWLHRLPDGAGAVTWTLREPGGPKG